MGKWMIPPQLLTFNFMHEPYLDAVPSLPTFCSFFSKPARYSNIHGPLNPEAERECRNRLVQPLTVQMGNPGPGKESDLPGLHSSLVVVSGQGPDCGEPFHVIPGYGFLLRARVFKCSSIPNVQSMPNHWGQEKYLWKDLPEVPLGSQTHHSSCSRNS